mgnify:FL=1
MGLSTERVNELLSDFNAKVHGLLKKHDLMTHKGTTMLDPIQKLVDDLNQKVMNNFTSPSTNEGMIESQIEMTLRLIEKEAAKLENIAVSSLAGMLGSMNATSPADNPVWNAVVAAAAAGVERLTMIYGPTIAAMPRLARDKLDADLARVLTQVEQSFAADSSANNANATKQQMLNAIAAIEKHLEKAAEVGMKIDVQATVDKKMAELFEREISLLSLEKSMTEQESQAWRKIMADATKKTQDLKTSNYAIHSSSKDKMVGSIDNLISILDKIINNANAKASAISGYYGNTGHRTHTKRSFGNISGSQVYRSNPNVYRNKPPGFKGFAGPMTADELRKKHPAGTNPAHIRAMEYFMSQGMSFNEAHEAAQAYGYDKDKSKGVLQYDLDRRTPHIGGGGDYPLF